MEISWIHEDVMKIYRKERQLNEMETCPRCKNKNRKRSYGMYGMKYSEFRKSSDYKKPTIIVGFNVGLHDSNRGWVRHLETNIVDRGQFLPRGG
jgi:hypothetical protein